MTEIVDPALLCLIILSINLASTDISRNLREIINLLRDIDNILNEEDQDETT